LKSFIAVAALFLILGCQKQTSTETVVTETSTAPAAATEAPAPAATAPEVQTIDLKVSGGEYQPASFNVQAGKPVRLNVTRDEKPTCGDVLTIPSQNISKPIPVNQVTTIEFTPQQPGDLEFTCGMNMMKGKIVVQ
jgi:plastocyanin domain-containing protein